LLSSSNRGLVARLITTWNNKKAVVACAAPRLLKVTVFIGYLLLKVEAQVQGQK